MRSDEHEVSIYFDAGLGDFFVAESHFSRQPDTIYWRSRARPQLQPLLERIHPEIQHINLWSSKDIDQEIYCDLLSPHRDESLPSGCENWQVVPAFFRCRYHLEFVGSSFLRNTCDEIDSIPLPSRFFTCQHDTPYNRPEMRKNRQLQPREWDWMLKATDLPIVVLGSSDSIEPPKHERIINCLGTTLGQSIEVLKQSEGYYGIDSCLSILACQLFDADHLAIKYYGTWYAGNRDLYAAPHTSYPFVSKELGLKLDTHMLKTVILNQIVYYKGGTATRGSILEVENHIAEDWIKHGLAEDWQPYKKGLQETASKLRDQLLGTMDLSTELSKPRKQRRAKK